jgi:Tol biopolymer transport system component
MMLSRDWLRHRSTVLACAAVAMGASAASAGAAFPGKSGSLAFVGATPGSGAFDVYTVGARGGASKALTSNARGAFDQQPHWSANGQTIVFWRVAPSGAGTDLFVMTRAGSQLTQLTHTWPSAQDSLPSYSASGNQIAYVQHDNVDGSSSLHVLDVTNGGLGGVVADRSLVTGAALHSLESPVFSPDGATIAYVDAHPQGTSYSSELYTIPAAGGTPSSPLTAVASGVFAVEPSWSPSGSELAYWNEDTGAQTSAIAAIRADGSGQRTVYTNPALSLRSGSFVADPAWAPRGNQIAFTQQDSGAGTSAVMVVAATGGTPRAILTTKNGASGAIAAGYGLDWQPTAYLLPPPLGALLNV